MAGSCLNAKVNRIGRTFEPQVSIVYEWGVGFYPLLVDEGTLFINFKDGVSPLFVLRK